MAIFIRIAAITGIGSSLKKSNNNHPMISVNIAMSAADIREVAPFFTLKAVRTRTAVAGSPQAIPETIFARPRPKTSRSLLKVCFVIFSAIFAEIRVSSIAITAIIKEKRRIILNVSRLEKKLISIFEKFGISMRENDKLGNLLAIVWMPRKAPGKICAHWR